MKTEIPTPRTDAAAKADRDTYEMSREAGDEHFPGLNYFLKSESAKLETELAQLRAQLEGMVNGQKQDQQHIERLERELASALESLKLNKAWCERDYKDIRAEWDRRERERAEMEHKLTEIRCELALSTASDDEKPIVTIRRISQQVSQLRAEIESVRMEKHDITTERDELKAEVERLHDIEHKCQVMGRELHETLAAYEQLLKGTK